MSALSVGESQLVRCGRMLQGPIDVSFIATGRSTMRRLKLSARRARMITLLVSQQGRFRFKRWMKHCRVIAAPYLEISNKSRVAVPRRSM